MFSSVIVSIVDHNVKSVKNTWAVSEKDKVTFMFNMFALY